MESSQGQQEKACHDSGLFNGLRGGVGSGQLWLIGGAFDPTERRDGVFPKEFFSSGLTFGKEILTEDL
jgi:hypothetical protein